MEWSDGRCRNGGHQRDGERECRRRLALEEEGFKDCGVGVWWPCTGPDGGAVRKGDIDREGLEMWVWCETGGHGRGEETVGDVGSPSWLGDVGSPSR